MYMYPVGADNLGMKMHIQFFFLFCCSFPAFSYFRKKRDPYYKEKFILANDKVDDHLANVYKNANQSVSYSLLMLEDKFI